MGLFNIIMTAMGFESEQKKPKKQKKQKTAQVNQTAQFNLGENKPEEKVKPIEIDTSATYTFEKEPEQPSNVLVYTPKTQKEVRKISDKIAEGESAIVNLVNFSEVDRIRAVDFLSGVAYILKYKIQRIEGAMFFIGPEGVEPMEYEVE